MRRELSFKDEVKTETYPVVTYSAEKRTKEVSYTYNVPETTSEPYETTRYDRVAQEQVEEYTVKVPVTVMREVTVQVCKMVPKVVEETILPMWPSRSRWMCQLWLPRFWRRRWMCPGWRLWPKCTGSGQQRLCEWRLSITDRFEDLTIRKGFSNRIPASRCDPVFYCRSQARLQFKVLFNRFTQKRFVGIAARPFTKRDGDRSYGDVNARDCPSGPPFRRRVHIQR